MTAGAISPVRALVLIVKLRAITIANQTARAFSSPAASKTPAAVLRTGTHRSRQSTSVRIAILAFAMALGMMWVTLASLEERHARMKLGEVSAFDRITFQASQEAALSEPFLHDVALLSAMLGLAVFLFTIGYQSRDIARLDTDVEWYLTLPVSVQAVYAGKVVERAVLSLGWILLLPFHGCLLWRWGYRWSLLPLAVVLTLVANALLAVVQFSFEVAARRLLAAQLVSALQAAATIGAMFAGLASVWFMIFRFSEAGKAWMGPAGAVALWFPSALGFEILQGAGRRTVWLFPAIHAIEVAAVALSGWVLVGWASRRGLEAIQTPNTGKRGRTGPARLRLFHGILSKDLAMLRRDYRTLATALTPLLVLVPLFVLPGLLTRTAGDPRQWGAACATAGAIFVASTVTNVLLHEGKALWLLYTVPRQLMRLFLEKSAVWVTIALLVALGLQVAGIAYRGAIEAADFAVTAWILASIPLLGLICSALAVLGTDPHASDSRRRLRDDMGALALLFAGLVAGAVLLPGAGAIARAVVLLTTVALALWQKARDFEPYLLDPTGRPPARIYAADGLTAIVLFFLLQTLAAFLFVTLWRIPPSIAGLAAYAIATGFTLLAVGSSLAADGLVLREAFRFLPKDDGEARRTAVSTALASLAVAPAAFVWFVYEPFGAGPQTTLPGSAGTIVLLAAGGVLVTAVARPVLEEVLFRGLVFRGFRQSMGFPVAALLSAALSGMVSPPEMLAPAIALGLAAAWTFERTGSLLAPVIVHAAFNAAVVLAGIVRWKLEAGG